MNSKPVWCSLFVLVAIGLRAHSTEPYLRPPVETLEEQDAGKDKPKDPGKDKKKPEDKVPKAPPPDVFSEALFPRTDLPTGFNPHMMGDLPGYFARQTVTVVGTQTTTFTFFDPSTETTRTGTVTTSTSQTKTILVPIAGAGAFKMGENSSPRPQDRCYVTYNYFGALRGPQIGPNAPLNVTNGDTSTFIPPAPQATSNVNREILGFEKTFLDGYASIELRVPLLQQSGNLEGLGSRFVGDLTIIGRYAFLLDNPTGNVISAGLAVTAPTGPGVTTFLGTIHSTYLQPWGGYIWNFDRFYVQGFHSVVVPTDARDVTLLFNDVGLNWWLLRSRPGRLLSSLVATVEGHVTTPLNHRSGDDAVFAPDIVVITSGFHLGLGRNTLLSAGVATPVTGPRVFGIETFVQLNWRF